MQLPALSDSRMGHFGGSGIALTSDSSQVFVRLQEIIARALDDPEQIIHRRDFLELFRQEPLEKIDRDIVVLLSREFDQPLIWLVT